MIEPNCHLIASLDCHMNIYASHKYFQFQVLPGHFVDKKSKIV